MHYSYFSFTYIATIAILCLPVLVCFVRYDIAYHILFCL